MVSAEQLADMMNDLHVEYAKEMNQMADFLSVRGEEGILLWLYRREKPAYAVNIIDHFGLTAGRVAMIISRLEQKHLIERRIDEEDLRRLHIELTEAGRTMAGTIEEKLRRKNLQYISILGEQGAEHLLKMLQCIFEHRQMEDH